MNDWQPSAPPTALQLRAKTLRQLREFFATRDCLEVDTPALSQFANPDPHIDSMPVTLQGGETRYLHTSPEFHMKRLLAAGSGDIYQVCHVFRDGEAGGHHNPEFTLLEWYRLGWDHHRLMDEVAGLLRQLLGQEGLTVETLSYQQAFMQYAGLDPLAATVEDYRQQAQLQGLKGMEDEQDLAVLQDWLFSHLVQSHLGQDRLTFIHAYPAHQAALARLEPADPRVCRRFEVYYQGMELGNGFHELLDAAEQRARFERQICQRRAAGKTELPQDESLLAALEAGLPDCAGVAIGLDRVVMLAAGENELAAVQSFAFDKA
jgi:lysyl-tRNA synthetase class 2